MEGKTACQWAHHNTGRDAGTCHVLGSLSRPNRISQTAISEGVGRSKAARTPVPLSTTIGLSPMLLDRVLGQVGRRGNVTESDTGGISVIAVK
jgi:hypothetical protein